MCCLICLFAHVALFLVKTPPPAQCASVRLSGFGSSWSARLYGTSLPRCCFPKVLFLLTEGGMRLGALLGGAGCCSVMLIAVACVHGALLAGGGQAGQCGKWPREGRNAAGLVWGCLSECRSDGMDGCLSSDHHYMLMANISVFSVKILDRAALPVFLTSGCEPDLGTGLFPPFCALHRLASPVLSLSRSLKPRRSQELCASRSCRSFHSLVIRWALQTRHRILRWSLIIPHPRRHHPYVCIHTRTHTSPSSHKHTLSH